MLRKLACAVFVLSAGFPAAAAPLPGAELQARTAGGEFRGYGSTRRGALEDFILRFRADGTVTSISQLRRKASQGSQFENYADSGVWRVEGNRLCVEFRATHRDLNGCFAVDGAGGDHVRLIGPVVLQGTLGH